MSEIYIVVEGIDYEGFEVICAFSDKWKANDLVEKCEKYQASNKKPSCPELDASEATWSEFYLNQEKYLSEHPAGKKHADGDYYSVLTTNLNPSDS